ncbi:MAG: porin family protein [Nitrospirota bacterium]|nr:porin family protein [Nitrospirota bacterium]
MKFASFLRTRPVSLPTSILVALSLLAALAAVPATAHAAGNQKRSASSQSIHLASTHFGYTYVEGGVGMADVNGPAWMDGSGLGIAASVQVSPNVFVNGGYASYNLDHVTHNVDMDVMALGVGLAIPVDRKLDLVASLGLEDVNTRHRHLGDPDGGAALGFGVRAQVAPAVEIQGGLSTMEVGPAGEAGLYIKGLFGIGDGFSVVAGLSSSDADVLSMRIRKSF